MRQLPCACFASSPVSIQNKPAPICFSTLIFNFLPFHFYQTRRNLLRPPSRMREAASTSSGESDPTSRATRLRAAVDEKSPRSALLYIKTTDVAPNDGRRRAMETRSRRPERRVERRSGTFPKAARGRSFFGDFGVKIERPKEKKGAARSRRRNVRDEIYAANV